MTINRRQFSAGLLGAGAASVLPLPARGAGARPVEGTHYVRLAQPVPVARPARSR